MRSEGKQEMVLYAMERVTAAWNVFYEGLYRVFQERLEGGTSHVTGGASY